jgi:hypothetical protein
MGTMALSPMQESMTNNPPGPQDVPAAASQGSAEGRGEETLLAEIDRCIDELDVGFDFEVLDVLDSEESTPAMIEALKDKLGTVLAARLFSIANSVHFGKTRSGKITRFMEVVSHLGTRITKSTAIFIALHALSTTEEIHVVFARCYATSKLTEAIAQKLGLSDTDRITASLGGLFIEIGKAIMLMLHHKHGTKFDAEFIERYYPAVNRKVVEKFALPEALIEIVSRPSFRFVKKDSLSLSAVVDMAHAVVEASFRQHGKLVVQSCMPDVEGIIYTSTAGSTLVEQFQIIGLGAYLKVISSEWTDVEKRLIEKHGKKA